MSIQLHRRIRRIEANVTGAAKTCSKIVLTAPPKHGRPKAWAQHRADLTNAIQAHDLIIVVSDQHPRREESGQGVVYVPNDFEAKLEIVANSPSRLGRRSLLHDLREEITGDIWGPRVTFYDGEDDDQDDDESDDE